MIGDERGEQLCRWWADLQNERATFDSHWSEAGRYVWPNQKDFLTPQVVQGEKKNLEVFDDTATENSKKYAAVLETVLTRRSTRWHKMTARDPKLRKSSRIRSYFKAVEDVLFEEREARLSGCYASLAQCYRSLGVFGNDALMVDDRWENGRRVGLRYKALDLRDVWVARDWQGGVAAIFHRYRLAASQLAVKYPADRIPPEFLERAKVRPFDTVEILLAVTANPAHRQGDLSSKPFIASELLVERKLTLLEGGYWELPIIFSRSEVANGEAYGRGPAMDLLPTIKTLNQMIRDSLRAGHKRADPPLLMRDDGLLGVTRAVRLKAGGLTRGGVDHNGRPMVLPLYTGGEPALALEMVEYFTKKLDRAFLVDLFTLLVERPQMTASEILERASEKGTFLGPTVGGQQSEKLAPMVEREIGLLHRQGKLPQMPDELIEAGGQFVLEYETPAAQMQRAGEVQAIESWALSVGVLGQQDPRAARVPDYEKIARKLAELRGVPPELVRDERAVEKLTREEAPIAAAAAAAEAVPQVAKGARDLSAAMAGQAA